MIRRGRALPVIGLAFRPVYDKTGIRYPLTLVTLQYRYQNVAILHIFVYHKGIKDPSIVPGSLGGPLAIYENGL